MAFTIDRVEFMNRVVRVNDHFAQWKRSSLSPLIDLFGGKAPTGTQVGSAAARSPQIEVDDVVRLLWGFDVVQGVPQAKRLHYQDALKFLLRAMGVPDRLLDKRPEYKSEWQRARTNANHELIHCSGVRPATVQASGGLDPARSTEVCIHREPTPHGWPWEFVFAFRHTQGNPIRPAGPARRFGFAANGFIYHYTPPAGTDYWSLRGAFGAAEIGLPNLVPLADLTPYSWDGRQALQVPWNT
jgi:hypothetical protein